MENLIRVPSIARLRAFDMKGSQQNRDVMSKNPDVDVSKSTLKEFDFERLKKDLYLGKSS